MAARTCGVRLMEREQVELEAPGLDRPGTLIRYGHYGRPVLVFPSEPGRAWDFENNGMVDAVADLIDAGRVKLYCVDSLDHVQLVGPQHPDRGARPAARAVRAWLPDQVVPSIAATRPAAPRSSPPAAAWAPTTRCTSPSARRPGPAGDRAVGQLRRDQLARLG